MQIRTLTLPVVLAAALSGAAAFPLAQAGNAVPVPLSDPNRPATVRIEMINGAMTIRGENRKDVLVTPSEDTSNAGGRGPNPRPRPGRRNNETEPSTAGLRQLTQRGGFEITESNNTVSIETGLRGANIDVRVPTRTNLRLEGLNGSGITVENVEGDIEAEHQNGNIHLTNVSGSVVTEAFNGNVIVVLTRIAGEKAMSFVSFNGNVDVTLPASAKANVRMRSDNGDVFSAFYLETRAATPPTPRRDGRGIKIEVNQAIFGAINGGGPEFELRTYNGNVYLRRGAN
jgi:hypothetical protein